MRFVVDECSGPRLAKHLAELGHDVLSIFDQARGSADAAVLQLALEQDRILITNDKDFGEMVFRDHQKHRGVVLMRLADESAASKIAVLSALLNRYGDQLAGRFTVVTERSARFTPRFDDP